MSENLNASQPEGADIIREQSTRSRAEDNTSPRGNATRRKLQVPSEEQCLAAMAQIPAMMMTGLMSTTQASVTKAVYAAVLQNLRQPKASAGSTVNSAPSLIEILRQQPSMIDSLAPMLTHEQFREIQQQVSRTDEAA